MTLSYRFPCDDTSPRRGTPDVACDATQKRWVLAASIMGSSLAFVDGTVVNIALPAIQRELRASVYQAQWVVESYALLLAALLLVGGALGDRLGRRRVFLLGVLIFAAASIAFSASALPPESTGATVDSSSGFTTAWVPRPGASHHLPVMDIVIPIACASAVAIVPAPRYSLSPALRLR